jgi:hypothetical protein
LLLVLFAIFEFTVAEDLQINQANGNRRTPKNENARQNIQAKVRAIARCAGGH